MQEPLSIGLFGPPGHGKTVIAVKAFPNAKKISFTRQGFIVMDTVMGIPVKAAEVDSVPKLIALVKEIIKTNKGVPYNWIFDDITLLVLETAKLLYEAEVMREQAEKQAKLKPDARGNVAQINPDWFAYYESIFDDLILLLECIWRSKGYCVATFQLKDEKFNEKTKQTEPGGINIAHKASANLLNYGFACLYRTGVCATRVPWPVTLICEGPFNKLYPTKDRLDVVQGMKDCPGNLAEVLRYRGHDITYPSELLPTATMEDIRKYAIDQSSNNVDYYTILKAVTAKYGELKAQWIRWAVTDGMDAYTIATKAG